MPIWSILLFAPYSRCETGRGNAREDGAGEPGSHPFCNKALGQGFAAKFREKSIAVRYGKRKKMPPLPLAQFLLYNQYEKTGIPLEQCNSIRQSQYNIQSCYMITLYPKAESGILERVFPENRQGIGRKKMPLSVSALIHKLPMLPDPYTRSATGKEITL